MSDFSEFAEFTEFLFHSGKTQNGLFSRKNSEVRFEHEYLNGKGKISFQ